METINFYKTIGKYGCFSNFSRRPVVMDNKTWATSEHYFQAMKFLGTKHEEEVRHAQSPMEAASMGRDRSRPLRSDWEQVKDDIMREVVLAKFKQCKSCRDTLLSTGEAVLVEHTVNDKYWGDGGDGKGKNMLGKILMEVRDILRKEVKIC